MEGVFLSTELPLLIGDDDDDDDIESLYNIQLTSLYVLCNKQLLK